MPPTTSRVAPPPAAAVRVLGFLRWSLPLALAAIALFVEWAEHLAEDEPISPYFLGELVIFAVVGPIAVWFTLGWVMRLVEAYQLTDEALRDANRDLESIVEERTLHLREATVQLEAANEDLARANQELRQLDRMKSEFVSLVSHQLRAPLTTVNGALELVAQDAEALPPASQRTLRILVQETERLSRLIQTILDVSRLEAGRLPLHLGPVALEPLLAQRGDRSPRSRTRARGVWMPRRMPPRPGPTSCSWSRSCATSWRTPPATPRRERPIDIRGGRPRRPAGGARRRPWTRRPAARTGEDLPVVPSPGR